MALDNLNKTIAKTTGQVGNLVSITNSLGRLFGIAKKAGPPPRSDLNQFKSKFLKAGVMRTDRFYMTINAPNVLTPQATTQVEIPFAAEATTLPGVMLATSEVARYGYGATLKNPYRPIFVDLNVSFISDGGRKIYDFFYDWINSIVKGDGTGDMHYNKLDDRKFRKSDLLAYEVEYRDNYKTDITITTVDETNRSIVIIRLYNAFPIALGDVPVSWSNSNDYMRIPVTFTYSNWSRDEIKIDQGAFTKPSVNLLQRLQGLGSTLNVLSSIRRPRNIGDMSSVLNNTNLALGNLGVNKN